MAELAQKERLQPSLLDRLTDDDPRSQNESRSQRVLGLQQLRESVFRDLAWLLNCGNLESAVDLDDYPLVAHSVLNYGVPELTGYTLSNANVTAIELAVRQAILDFEPRIIANSLKVSAVVAKNEMSRNSFVFEIEGDLWAQPIPLRLFMKTEVDLETGSFTIEDATGQG